MKALDIRECLEILGVESASSAIGLKVAYRQEISKWHPDRFHNDPDKYIVANDRAKKINAAYEYLSELLDRGLSVDKKNEGISKEYSSYRTQHVYNSKSFIPGFPDPTVFEVFLKSSNIVSTGYNRTEKILYIKFDENMVYCYFQVPETVFQSFLSASSHGKFAHKNIYHQYKYVRLS